MSEIFDFDLSKPFKGGSFRPYHKMTRYAVVLSVVVVVLWFVVLKFGSLEAKRWATAAVIISPFPPVP